MDLQRRLLAADGGGAQAQPMTLCCCCCVRCCPDTRGLRQTTYEIMNTGAVEASLNTPVLERRWTFFAGTAVEVLVLSMIIGNCVFVLGDAETVVNDFLPFEIISTIFFTLEYAVRCWSCSIEPTFRDWRGRLRWARQPLQIIDLICLVAFYIDIFNILRFAPQHQRMAGTIYFRMLRVLRLLSLFKMERQVRAFSVMKLVLHAKMNQLMVCFYGIIVIVAVFGSLMYNLEASEPDGNLVTIQAALIWAFQAITTVGLTPSPGTGAGQVLNCILSVVGVLVLALPAGIIAAGFTEIHEEERRTRALKKSASFKFRANAIASRKEREKMQLAADAGVDVKATAPSDTSVEVQPMLNSPTTPHNGADVDSADFVSAECLARVEERQQRLEASMARMEAMLSSLVASAKQPREAGQQRDDWSYQSTEFDTTASRLLGAE